MGEGYQVDYDGRGQQSCKCNFVHFYKERPGPHAHTAWAVNMFVALSHHILPEGNSVASVTLFTFTLKPGPHAHTVSEALPLCSHSWLS